MANQNPFQFNMDTALRFPQSSYDFSDLPGNMETYGEQPGGPKCCCSNGTPSRVFPPEHNYLLSPLFGSTNELSDQICPVFLDEYQRGPRFSVEFNQHSTPQPSQHYIQQPAAPQSGCDAQNFLTAQSLWPAAPQSLQNIYGPDPNFLCEQPSPPWLGHGGKELALPWGDCYLHRSQNALQICGDPAALYGTSNSQIESRSVTNASQTYLTNHWSIPDNYSELFHVPPISGNLPDLQSISNSHFRPSNITNTFDQCPTSHYSMNNNRDQVSQTPTASQDLSDPITTYRNGSDWSAFDSNSQYEDFVIPIQGSNIPNITEQAGGEMAAPSPLGFPRSKAPKKKAQQKKRKPFSDAKKLRVNAMRKQGACWSCRANKKQVCSVALG
jgi:hypothetical protein